MFEVPVLQKTCVIVIVKIEKLKERKSKSFSHNLEVCIWSTAISYSGAMAH